jgi:pyruvate kinase
VIRISIDSARNAGYVQSGQHVVVTGGVPLHVPGKTNFIKVDRVD